MSVSSSEITSKQTGANCSVLSNDSMRTVCLGCGLI